MWLGLFVVNDNVYPKTTRGGIQYASGHRRLNTVSFVLALALVIVSEFWAESARWRRKGQFDWNTLISDGSIRVERRRKRRQKRVTSELLRDTHCARNVGRRLVRTAAGSFKNPSSPLLPSPLTLCRARTYPISNVVYTRAFTRTAARFCSAIGQTPFDVHFRRARNKRRYFPRWRGVFFIPSTHYHYSAVRYVAANCFTFLHTRMVFWLFRTCPAESKCTHRVCVYDKNPRITRA